MYIWMFVSAHIYWKELVFLYWHLSIGKNLYICIRT
jgi:hypothetical protein